MGKEMLTEAYRRLTGRLRGVAAGILKSDDDVSDALQEAFCRLWAAREPLSDCEAEGRLVTTVRRISIDTAVGRRRVAHLPQETSDSSPQPYAAEHSDMFSAHHTGRQQLLLEALPDMQRKVFELVGLSDFDYDVAAERLGISEQACRTNMCRARKTLRSLYNKI